MSLHQIKNPKITDFSHEIFGGILLYDGAGYYPGLELINLIFLNNTDNLLPLDKTFSFNRKSMEFARKLVWDEEFSSHPEKENILFDELTQHTLAKLLECLQMDIPNVSGRPAWHRAHFFPYTQSLIHYDARKRRNTVDSDHRVEVERKYLRGAGALAFKVLRLDPNNERKQAILDKLNVLFEGTYGGPLDQLANVFQSASNPKQSEYVDDIEKEKCTVLNDSADELLRDGFLSIVSHTELTSVKRTKAIVNWVAIWLLILQARRAAVYEEHDAANAPFIMDIANKNTQLRRAARGSFDNTQKAIDHALDRCINNYNALSDNEEDLTISKKGRNDLKGFFSSTAAILGILNSNKGRRHFTLKVDALETLVLAGIPQGEEMSFDQFLNEWLGERCNFLIGKKMAERNALLNRFDGAIFEDNEAKLSEHLLAAGLLTQYSDATRMVGVNHDN